MKSFEEPREWLNIWPSFADIAICAMIVFLIYALYLISLLPKQIQIGELKDNNQVFFESGKADPPDEFKRDLDKMYDQILHMPEWRDSSWVIVVKGHTDNVQMKGYKYENNWELSAARALKVVDHFVGLGVNPKRIRAIGYGEHKFLKPHNVGRGTPENRRIEVILFKSDGRI